MKNSFRLLQFALVAAMAVSIVALGFWQWRSVSVTPLDAQAISFELVHSNFLDHRFDVFLGRAAHEIEENYSVRKRIVVNGLCSKDAICVYVVNEHRNLSSLPESTAKLLGFAKDNFLSVKPNLILIDGRFLNLLLLEVTNASLMFEEASSNTFPKRDYVGVRESEDAQIAARRFGNLAIYNSGGENDQAGLSDDTYRTVAYGLTAMDSGQPIKSAPDVLGQILVAGVSPIMLHEIGHLERGRSGHFLEGFSLSPDLLREELLADDYAHDHVEMYLKSGHVRPYERSEGAIAVGTFGSLLRDMALARIFAGFRGLSVQEFRVGMFHADCKGLSREYIGLASSGMLRGGFRVPFPIVTPNEFATLHDKAMAGAGRTHASAFVRSELFWSLSSEKLHDNYQPVLLSVLTGNRDEFKREYKRTWFNQVHDWAKGANEATLNYTNFPSSYFVTALPAAKVENALNCPGEKCSIGHFTDINGFYELSTDHEMVQYARIVFQLLRHRTDNAKAIDVQALNRAYNGTLHVVQKFVSANEDAAVPVNSVEREFRAFWARQASCGAASLNIATSRGVLSLTTTNESAWIAMTIIPISYHHSVPVVPTNYQSTPFGDYRQ